MAVAPLSPHNCLKSFTAVVLLTLLSACTGPSSRPDAVDPLGAEPIAYIGHGAFFERDGRQIVPTVAFVERAQRWYRGHLLAGIGANRRRAFADFEERLFEGVNAQGQARLVVQQRALQWLVAHSLNRVDHRIRGKLNALAYRLDWMLPIGDGVDRPATAERFVLDPALIERLARSEFDPGEIRLLSETQNSGEAYRRECVAAGVPFPPPIGRMELPDGRFWRSLGFIPMGNQFINPPEAPDSPAEVRVFTDASGICIALPRYTDVGLTTVRLDGVICLSRTTSRVCIWDNQRRGRGFDFPAEDEIPIGVPATEGGLYQAGGAELEGGDGGVCTDCHAGENPYIIHPGVELRNGPQSDSPGFDPPRTMRDLSGALGLPTFAPARYVPLVPAVWPQNELSQVDVPEDCGACHKQGRDMAGALYAGRLPHVSRDLEGFCGTILRFSIHGGIRAGRNIPATMPDNPLRGMLGDDPNVQRLQDYCNTFARQGPSNRGDPHITTTNGINYDFQAAGEFVALRNSGTGFELQTRQTPVFTSTVPGINPHTGLASCVSLNTAAAVRVGERRISYQPVPRPLAGPEDMELRIDGRLVSLPAGGLNLGGGNRIAGGPAGAGIDVRAADGTRLIVTPSFWASQGYWYLDIEVLNTPAREGLMGHIPPGSWLPLSPRFSSYGPAPPSLVDRQRLLNWLFADDWRVTAETSLFDYLPGISTANYTDRGWPPPSGSPCFRSPVNPWPGGPGRPLVEPMQPAYAKRLCRRIRNEAANRNCVFDMVATGHAGVAQSYLRTLRARTTP